MIYPGLLWNPRHFTIFLLKLYVDKTGNDVKPESTPLGSLHFPKSNVIV